MSIAAYIDNTLLKADATPEMIRRICAESVELKTASVCVNPAYVPLVKQCLEGSGVKTCCVIGFPLGMNATRVKAFEAAAAVEDGAEELDTVINVGMLKAGETAYVKDDIKAVVDAAKGRLVKVIIETCLLTQEEKETLCRIVTQAKADYIKTSTGFSTGGATFEDVALMRRLSGPEVKVKAAGGISSLEDAKRFLELGADRLGTSRIVKAVKAMENKQ